MGLGTELSPKPGPEHGSSVFLTSAQVSLRHWWQGQLHDWATCAVTRAHAQKGPTLGLMIWCHPHENLNV